MAFEVADVDVADPRGWVSALAPYRAAGLELLGGFEAQCDDAVLAARGRSGLRAFRVLRALLTGLVARRQRRRAAELAALATGLGVPRNRLLFANLAYDLAAAAPAGMVAPPGCSTFVAAGPGGPPIHARNLDWHFPGTLLRDHALVFRMRGAPAGPYTAVGWPGLTGVLTAVAPGRFSVSVNFVKRQGDGFGRLLARAAAGATPVAWAVRDAFERAATFDEAVAHLATVRLLAPVLLTVAGVREGEACVIEREPGAAEVRRSGAGATAVCVTNHYGSGRLRGRSVDYDAGDTLVRLRCVEAGLASASPADAAAAFQVLAPAVRGHTQQQVVMCAADGLLRARVPGDATDAAVSA